MPIQHKWIEGFSQAFGASGVGPGQWIVVASESESNPDLVAVAQLALQRLGARVTCVQVPSPPASDDPPIRSTGASTAFDDFPELMTALGQCELLIDCTVEGLLHSRARQGLLQAGGRLLMIPNEHPEILERCLPDTGLKARVDYSLERLQRAKQMHITSDAGTELSIDVTDAPCRAGAGFLSGDDKIAYWPAGLCLCFPLAGTVNGTVVINVGDVNLTFKRYVESPVTLTIKNDQVIDVAGEGLDTIMLRSYYDAWDDPAARAISHVGWGLNPRANWEALNMYDKSQCNGTELRTVEGSFMISTGANEFADRYTPCHFDIPMRHCTVQIDDEPVVVGGKLQPDFQ